MACCFRHHALAIGFRLLLDTSGLTAGFRHNFGRVSFCLVARTVLILARGLYVTERVNHLCWRINLLQLHETNLDTRAISVQRILHQLPNIGFNRATLGRQNRLNITLADNFAHRAFGHRFNRGFRFLNIEHKVGGLGGVYLPLYREINIDDILVARQHQAFFSQITLRVARTTLA